MVSATGRVLPPGDCPECDAQWNTVAAASVAFQEELARLGQALVAAHDHGLSIPELCEASGLSEHVVRHQIKSVSA